MSEIPGFFLPGATPGKDEELYAAFAESVGHAVPEFDKRIYSINFRHNGEEWTATVGQTMSGNSLRTIGRGNHQREIKRSHSDPATVRAIFAGAPVFRVFTDGSIPSWWVNGMWSVSFTSQYLKQMLPRFNK
jgi:hypothetical protein